MCCGKKIRNRYEHFASIFRAEAGNLLHAGFLFVLFFGPEDGGGMFLLNVRLISTATRRYIPEGRNLHNH
jgi:hypothetical protein